MRTTLVFVLFASLFMYSVGCGNANTTDSETDTSMEDTLAMETPAETTVPGVESGDNYEITALKADLPSPRKQMKGTAGGAAVTVNYGSPSVKGRTIWGDLEKYGEVWRAGANEATTFEVSQAVTIEGKALPAGRYSLFVIPNESEDWTIIFNKTADQWGAYEYDASKDALRVNVAPVETSESRETLDYLIDGDKVVMRWDKIALPFTVAAAG